MSIFPSFRARKGSNTNNHLPLSIEIWDPFESFSLTPFASWPLATPSVDWKETPEAHVFIAEVPGLKKEEMKVEVEKERVLKISGQRSQQIEEKGDKWHRRERSSDNFIRSVRLPANAKVGKAKAVLENGILTVTLPKEQEVKAKGRLLEIEG